MVSRANITILSVPGVPAFSAVLLDSSRFNLVPFSLWDSRPVLLSLRICLHCRHCVSRENCPSLDWVSVQLGGYWHLHQSLLCSYAQTLLLFNIAAVLIMEIVQLEKKRCCNRKNATLSCCLQLLFVIADTGIICYLCYREEYFITKINFSPHWQFFTSTLSGTVHASILLCCILDCRCFGSDLINTLFSLL